MSFGPPREAEPVPGESGKLHGSGSLVMLIRTVRAVGVVHRAHRCRRAARCCCGRATTPTATCLAGSFRFPMSRRCTPVWSWPSRRCSGALCFTLKTTPGLPTAAAKIALGMAATGLAYIPLVVAAVTTTDGSHGSGLAARVSDAAVRGRAAGRCARSVASCCGLHRPRVAVAGSVHGMSRRQVVSGWPVGSEDCGTVLPHSLFFIGLAAMPLAGLVLVSCRLK
jgi:hypothetical protein